MTEPQPRRYLTRARSKAEDNTVGGKLPYRRKASTANTAPSTCVTRATKRAASPWPTLESVAVKTAPKRKYTRNGGGARKKIIVAAKTSENVPLNDDKENLVPFMRGNPAICPACDDTDELMSSMGALSVKPIRVPSTKLRLPTTNMNVSSAFDPLPALSPSKARRIPRRWNVDVDSEMVDELSSPQPKLAAKPKRAVELSSPIKGFAIAIGATDPRKPLDLSTPSLAPLARQPSTSTFRPSTSNTPLSKSSSKFLNSVPKSSLASPPRRRPTLGHSTFGCPTGGGFKRHSNLSPSEILHFLKPNIKSLPKRVKVSDFVKIDESEDELGMDTDNYMFDRSPTRLIKERVERHAPFELTRTTQENTSLEPGDVLLVKREPKQSSPSTVSPSFSPRSRSSGTVRAKTETASDTMNVDGDTNMDDLGEMNQIALSPAELKGRASGRNCYDFFNLGGDRDDEFSETRSVGDTFSEMDLQLDKRRTLLHQDFTSEWPEVPMAKQQACIAIDPVLLTLGAPPNFVGIVDSPSRTTTVPVKMHSVDDLLNEDEGNDGENHLSLNKWKEKNPTNKCCVIRPAGVLAGAVVFVDVYTFEGADASTAFVEALRGLGAKVLENWNWSPNSNGASGERERKVGITHVVFKDGSPKTLQKVKDSNGVVLCVGVAWVTACEDGQMWADEGNYPVDLDHVPRGGHRRRRSMEPKALTMIPGGSTVDNFCIPPVKPALRKLQTEASQKCADETNPVLMHNLTVARGKSTQFAPKIGSPLRRFPPMLID